MPRDRATPVAWVESPLQMIGAAEWARAHRTRVDVAGRLTTQVEETAAELTARGAPFARQAGFYGIPWAMLRGSDHWLVGDGFSGQFRLAAAILRPRSLTFLDDGLQAVSFADALTGARAFSRPGAAEQGLARRVAPVTMDLIRLRAAAGRVSMFTAFELGQERAHALRDLGARIEEHDFAWVRGTRAARPLPAGRVILGSARVVDGLMPREEYLEWIRAEARAGGAVYVPHRREPRELVAEVGSIPRIRVVEPGLPIELVLAGDPTPREIVTLPSSAATTLRRVLRASECVVVERGADARVAEARG
ncbi:hypothetical protein [Microbacterium sp. ZXX196]|uniref:hypothetical protein n=1 Tax=Microbacterium sp. ZXX196 TaxID=2609291 RepID=UPI0012B81E04|nr:hypothetical protein [Microbacterium sp. ZXX196]MTE23783.1 hypothetical protein [Microbacterium sp. ZXX196]